MQLKLLAPPYWPLWFLIGLLRILIKLPYRMQLILGKGLGRTLLRFPLKMRRTAQVNLTLCFPELTTHARAQLLRENFESIGVGVFETALGWWGSDARLKHLAHWQGTDQLEVALSQGRGALLCGAHFTCLELAGRLAAQRMPLAVVYRPQKNPLLEYFNQRALHKHYLHVLRRDDLRGILRCLKNNVCVWYTPDVDAGLKNSLFADFFGVAAASITATPRLAKISQAAIVPAAFYRRADGTGYDLHIAPALEQFPSADIQVDVQRINQMLEAAVRVRPAQYIWQYKRFKTRPPSEARFY